MKNIKVIPILIVLQFVFSCLQAYLITKISWIGRIGIRFFYKEYTILRSGWKTAALFFAIQLFIILLLWFIQKKCLPRISYWTGCVLLVLALIGLMLTYNDFQHTYTHRLLKERFHLGFYLFWTGWIISCIYFLIGTRIKSLHRAHWPEDRNTVPPATFDRG
jgi:hypothetical protein